MSRSEPYSDEHRIFVQGIMTRGILNSEEVYSLLDMACRRCDVEMPVDRKEKSLKLVKFIQTINRELEPMGMIIKKALDEDTKMKAAFFVLCNNYDRSEDISQLTVKAMVTFSPNEMTYIKMLMENIIRSEDKEISPTFALNCANFVNYSNTTKKFTQQDAEVALKKFMEQKWLKYDNPQHQSQIRLSTRFIAEMHPYLQDARKKSDEENEDELEEGFLEMAKEIGMCPLCNNLVIRSINCLDCGAKYHLYCIFQTAEESTPETGKCKKCKKPVPIRRKASSRENHERKRKAQLRLDEDE